MHNIKEANVNRKKTPESPVVLAILDGWGHREEVKDNAVKSANAPIMDALWHAYPHTFISASGADVGYQMVKWAILRLVI